MCAECGESVTKIDVNHFKRIFSRFSQKLRAIDVGFKNIRNDVFKYIISANKEEQLYDISKDPLERKNIVYELPDKAKELRGQMKKIIDVNYFGPKEIVGTEAEKRE